MLYKKENKFLSIYVYEDELYPDSVILQKNSRTGDPVDTLIPKELILEVARKLNAREQSQRFVSPDRQEAG